MTSRVRGAIFSTFSILFGEIGLAGGYLSAAQNEGTE